jgi:hypothetical protein
MPRTSQNVVVARPHILFFGGRVSFELPSPGLYAAKAVS